MSNIQNTISLLKTTFPESKFEEVKTEWKTHIEENYGEIPADLKTLYNQLGYGTIGDSYYSIHYFLEPDELFDPSTAAELNGKLIVGDDFAGSYHAIDPQNNWSFGHIGYDGVFEKIDFNFIDFLHNLCLIHSDKRL